MPSDKIGARVVAALLAEGVIAGAMPQGDIAGFAPPLCMTQNEADQIVAALTVAMNKVFAQGL
jgi:L-2,4-diaminobutyrate transaminase